MAKAWPPDVTHPAGAAVSRTLDTVKVTRTIVATVVLVFAVAAPLGGVDTGHPGSAGAAANTFGDTDCSGAVDEADALQVLRSVAGVGSNTGCLRKAGDVDCSGAISPLDALRILRYAAGLPNPDTEECIPIGEEATSSQELIAAALEAGEITDEEATVYGVLAVFGDSRLPGEFRGTPDDLPDSDAAMLAAVKFEGMSQAAQDTLRPFLTPPYVEGSWLDLQTAGGAAAPAATSSPTPTISPAEWTTFEAAGGKVKVWGRNAWPTEVLKAEDIAEAVTDSIWPSLITLMGAEHAPLSDAGYENNGGDGALDIYVVDIEGALGLTVPYIDIPEDPTTGEPIGPCEMSPSYIQIEPDEPIGSAGEPGIVSTVAHEVFHAFQLSFDLYTNCWFPEYKWFMEASATWAEDHVYPAANAEHAAAGAYLWNPATSLDYAGILSFGHEYGAYLFPFFATRRYGPPDLVRTIWEGFTTANSLPAIDAALDPYGGIDRLWPEFVLHNWNGSTTSWYKDWDGLEGGADLDSQFGEMVYPPGGGSPQELEGAFDYLAARYYKVHFPSWSAFPVRSVTFKNPMWQNPAINVQAIVKVADQWQPPEDSSGKEEVTFCRDEDEAKRMEQMILIISNSDWRTMQDVSPATPPTLEGSETGCSRWVGEATMDYHRDDDYGIYDRTAEATDLVFEAAVSASAADTQQLELKSGTLAWSFEAYSKIVGCAAKFSGTFSATVGGSSSLSVTPADNKMTYRGRASTQVSGEGECSVGSASYEYSFTGPETWFSTGPVTQISGDPAHLVGEYNYVEGIVTIHYTWDLRAAPPEDGP